MEQTFLFACLIGGVSLLYATAGQAGGTGFLAAMALAHFPAAEMRPTALLLNIVAAGYAAWRLRNNTQLDRRLLAILVMPSLPAAFLGGLVALHSSTYFLVVGGLLLAAAALIVFRGRQEGLQRRRVKVPAAVLVGACAGLLSGLTGVGGGVLLAPQLIALRWTSAKEAAALSPPFILCNSTVGLLGALMSGQHVASGSSVFAVGALLGAMLGTVIGHRWMSEKATAYVLAGILLLAGCRLISR